MSATTTIARSAQIDGRSFTYGRQLTTDGAVYKEPTLAAAKNGTLTTRTSDTAGTLTMSGGHGFTDGQVLDIYWADGQVTSATIGTVSVNSVPFTGATGTLPLNNTVITAMVQHIENLAFADADLKFLGLKADLVACSATLFDVDDNVVGVLTVEAGGKHRMWDDEIGEPIPVSDDVTYVALTHGDSSAAHQVLILAANN